jgi:Protein of unknown function (DUF1236)
MSAIGFRRPRRGAAISGTEQPKKSGTMRHPMHWQVTWLEGRWRGAGRSSSQLFKETTMRNRLLTIAAIAGALGVPVAAQAQSDTTVGVARGGYDAPLVAVAPDGIAVEQVPAFREYVVRERVPVYTVPERVIVGTTLPDVGVTYYDVPQTFGATPYRYTVVNGQTVLVEPRSRRIVQVIN